MSAKCFIEEFEGRDLDAYDLITLLDLLKDQDCPEIWRRYSPGGRSGRITLNHMTDKYFLEMTVQDLPSLALSPKYNASAHLLQSFIRRIVAGHRHSLILQRLRHYGVPIEDETQIHLGCSVGTIGVDLVVNYHAAGSEERFKKYGTSLIETEEKRPLDHYDATSIIILSMYRTSEVLRRYCSQEILAEGLEDEKIVSFTCQIGEYTSGFRFHQISNTVPRQIPARGNVAAYTLIRLLRRLCSHHAPELIFNKLNEQGIVIAMEDLAGEFGLARIVNNSFCEIHFEHWK
jgi:hypothetical protein